jgi:hypothetical protein
MFCPLVYRDAMVVFRGLLILAVVIILGVSVTEKQLNSLTQRQESVQAFHITHDRHGVYSIYLLGSSYTMSAAYTVGQIINNDKSIGIKTKNHSVTIPTYIVIDCKKELAVLNSWARLFVEKGFEYKSNLDLYITVIQQKINVYIRQFR